jgi:hypothetical protein
MGGANPCNGWCLDPMIAMLSAAAKIDSAHITVESTLLKSDKCKMLINTKFE